MKNLSAQYLIELQYDINMVCLIRFFPAKGLVNEYLLTYVLFNTFLALLPQGEQVRCYVNVARHLTPDGVFVIEAFVPDLARFTARQALRAISVGEDELRIDASQLDPLNQRIANQHVVLTEEGVRLYPVKLRYVWPSELDLMARLAGLRLH